LDNKIIYFSITSKISEEFLLQVDISQELLLLLIFFLLYNIKLIKIYLLLKQKLYIRDFVNNIYLIVINISIKANYSKLVEAYRKILEYTQYYGIHFILAKYKLIHFIKTRNKFNLVAIIRLNQSIEYTLSPNIQVLGV
jgi:hypothetical protein